MQTVRQWLERLGLSQYAEIFDENDVDFEALRLLSESDLEKLGITLGNRKKLLAAIARLHVESPSGSTPDERVHQQFLPTEAERRQLTVMFCDLVGSTALASALDAAIDPEATPAFLEGGGLRGKLWRKYRLVSA